MTQSRSDRDQTVWTAHPIRRRRHPGRWLAVGVASAAVLILGLAVQTAPDPTATPSPGGSQERRLATAPADASPREHVPRPQPAVTEPVGEEPSVEASTAPPLRATAAAPADLWIVGDSLTETFGPALAEAARATGVLLPDHELRYSSGLTRPDFYDWPARLARRLAEGELDIIVFMIGANDAQAIETSGGWVDFGSSAWMEEYRRRVKQTAETLSVGARTVYWVGQPIARPATYSQRMGILNDIYRSVAESHPGIRYVSSWELFATEGSSYADRLADRSGTEVRVRAADGIHLTTAGGERLSAHVIQSIEQDWVLGR